MLTQQTQIKINLPVKLKTKVKAKADEFGLTMASYVKYLLINDIKILHNFPTYQASDRLEKITKGALENMDRFVKVNDIEEFLSNL
ncbi:hypothetical protein KKE45_00325, partial [Patescibacteria group bacterium]|nr:hypothetical protein [Patescibacteria group bacterium]